LTLTEFFYCSLHPVRKIVANVSSQGNDRAQFNRWTWVRIVFIMLSGMLSGPPPLL
jgi:hypothetical protein